MIATTPTGRARRWMPMPARTSPVAFVILLLLAVTPPLGARAVAQDAGLTVMVGDKTYLVNGVAVSARPAGEPVDADTARKANFTARVLDEQILHSDYNKIQYDAAHRAIIYADALSEKRIEPWRQPLLNGTGDAALADAKAEFKAWAGKIVDNPRDLTLAVARKDTLDGIAAYRDNAVIYRKVTRRNGVLTYEEAVRFAQNQIKTLRMAFARALEERLANRDPNAPGSGVDKPGAAGGAQPQAGTGDASKAGPGGKDTQEKSGDSAAAANDKNDLKQKVQSEVIDKVDSGVKTPEDLDHSYDRLRDIVTADSTDLQNNRDLQDYAKSAGDIRAGSDKQIAAYESSDVGASDNASASPVVMFDSPTIRMTYAPPPRYTGHLGALQQLQRREYFFGGKDYNPQSTITGEIHSTYQPVTREAAQTIVGKYRSIPGGVTLEGASPDLASVKTVSYDAKANAFIINDDLVYLSPIAIDEFTDIARALAKDDKLGVSLGSSLALVYGSLSPQTAVASNLKMVDKFMAAIAFGNLPMLPGYRFAPGYVGQRVKAVRLAVYFNIHNFRFTEDDSGEVKRSGADLDTTLVPLSIVGNPDGSHRPDFERIDSGDVPEAYAANLKNMQENIGYYARERIVRRAVAYGEAAAFARALRDNKVQTDFATWSPGVATLSPGATPASLRSGSGAGPEDCALSAVHWSSTKSIGTRAAYEDHLQRFPNCPFATLATARIAALDQKAGAPAATERERPARAKRQGAAQRRTASDETPRTRGALDCSRPEQIVACAYRALGTSPLPR